MPTTFFITGTDTGVGKTLVSVALLYAANDRGLSTVALKPITAGCEHTSDGLRNEDAVLLQQAINTPLHYNQVNPIALKPAIAPHIAAEQSGQYITLDSLTAFCRNILKNPIDFAIVEGAGGWRVPINDQETLADLAKALSLPVIMVVGMRLGCLNHAYLTTESILRDGLTFAGWISNRIDSAMPAYRESLKTLERSLTVPCLGHIPFFSKPLGIDIRNYIDIDKLLF